MVRQVRRNTHLGYHSGCCHRTSNTHYNLHKQFGLYHTTPHLLTICRHHAHKSQRCLLSGLYCPSMWHMVPLMRPPLCLSSIPHSPPGYLYTITLVIQHANYPPLAGHLPWNDAGLVQSGTRFTQFLLDSCDPLIVRVYVFKFQVPPIRYSIPDSRTFARGPTGPRNRWMSLGRHSPSLISYTWESPSSQSCHELIPLAF